MYTQHVILRVIHMLLDDLSICIIVRYIISSIKSHLLGLSVTVQFVGITHRRGFQTEPSLVFKSRTVGMT